jgi:hypothetical protein
MLVYNLANTFKDATPSFCPLIIKKHFFIRDKPFSYEKEGRGWRNFLCKHKLISVYVWTKIVNSDIKQINNFLYKDYNNNIFIVARDQPYSYGSNSSDVSNTKCVCACVCGCIACVLLYISFYASKNWWIW